MANTRHLYGNPQKDFLQQSASILIPLTLLAIGARLFLFPFVSNDYTVFLSGWFDELQAGGGFFAIGRPIGDYTPFYIYIMAALTYLPIDSLYSIKLVSCIGDVLLALFAMKIIWQMTASRGAGILTYALVLALPTVVLNSAAWAQCDSIYTAALLAFVYYMLQERPVAGMVAFSIAFFLKLQAVFLAPVILLLLMKRRVRFWQLFIVPGIYVLSVLPAFFAGRGFFDLLTVYFRQAGSYSGLSLGAPNFYALIDTENTWLFTGFGLFLFGMLMLVLFYFLGQAKFTLTPDVLLTFSLFSTIMMPFLLPHMHERYFYPADILAVLYAVRNPNRWPVPVLVVGSSLCVVCRYLFGLTQLHPAIFAFPMLVALILVARDLAVGVKGASFARQGV